MSGPPHSTVTHSGVRDDVPCPGVSVSEGGGALRVASGAPHLVSMGGGRLSTAVTIHPLPEGRVTLGSSSDCDIVLSGTGVCPYHCQIEHSNGVVTLYAYPKAYTAVDGLEINSPCRLTQGSMLTIGRSNYLRFNNPPEARLMKSVLPDSNSRISMAPINFSSNAPITNSSDKEGYDIEGEYITTDSSGYHGKKKPPVAPRRYYREENNSIDENTGIINKVSKFEYMNSKIKNGHVSPKVFTSDSVTVNTPAKDVLGKNISNFTKNLPQSAVNYSENTKQPTDKNLQFESMKSNHNYTNVSPPSFNYNNRVVLHENNVQSPYVNVSLNNVGKEENSLCRNTGSNPSLRYVGLSSSKDNINVINNLPDSNHHAYYLNSPNSNYSRNTVNKMNNQNFNQSQNSRFTTPSPSFNRNPQGSSSKAYQSQSSLEAQNASETQRQKAHLARMREQENEKIEKARLEEILSMCAEYEKQNANMNKPPLPNRIKTNGSLPRDKKSPYCVSPSYGENMFSFEPEAITKNNTLSAYENIALKNEQQYRNGYENVEISKENSTTPIVIIQQSSQDMEGVGSPYENVYLGAKVVVPNSPRTRIKTYVQSPKKSDSYYDYDLVDQCKSPELVLHDLNSFSGIQFMDSSDDNSTPKHEGSTEERKSKEYEENLILKDKRIKILEELRKIKIKIADFQSQEEELMREVEMEKALVSAEYNSETTLLMAEEQKKSLLVDKVKSLESERDKVRKNQEHKQHMCAERIQKAQDKIDRLEELLKEGSKDNDIMDQLKKSRSVLENERKIYEDLEFQYLEDEADWLAYLEELHTEVAEMTQNIDNKKSHLLLLDAQKTEMYNSSCNQTKSLEQNKLSFVRELEVNRNILKEIDSQLIYNGQKVNELLSDMESEEELLDKRPPGEHGMMAMSLYGPDFDKNWKTDTMSMSMNENMFRNNIEFNRASSTPKRPVTEVDRQQINQQQMANSFQQLEISNGSFTWNNSNKSSKSSASPAKGLDYSSYGLVVDEAPVQRVPSQDDIDRISRVTSEAPICGSNGASRAEQSLREIERNRQLLLQQKGSLVIEQERQRLTELKLRIQTEVCAEWEEKHKNISNEINPNGDNDEDTNELNNTSEISEYNNIDNCEISDKSEVIKRKSYLSVDETTDRGNSVSSVESQHSIEGAIEKDLFDQADNNSSCCCSKKKEEEDDQVMNQQPITTQIRNLSDHTESFRPLSEGSDSMYDTTPLGSGAESLNDVHSSTAILHRSRQNRLPQHQRPLTRYLPILSEDLNLRSHILSAGHQLDQCPHVIIDSTSCRGYLQKLGAKWHGWSKRWFLFDRTKGAFIYYADKSEKKPRGGAYFKAIDEVYLDHSVAAHNTFIVKTRQRHYKLLAPSSQAARIWIDSICTGAMGNMAYDL